MNHDENEHYQDDAQCGSFTNVTAIHLRKDRRCHERPVGDTTKMTALNVVTRA